jgi:porphobilinogen synthase
MLPNNRQYPNSRMRRTRMHAWSRALVQESQLSPQNLILPCFIIAGSNQKIAIKTMPGVYRLSIDNMLLLAKEAASLGIKAIAIFPVIEQRLKTATGEEALNPDNLVIKAIKSIKDAGINIGIITDIALDPYTDHGHDGLLKNGDVDNDSTVEVLCNQALLQAEAGCDILAPSDMQDGRIGAIRSTLEEHNFTNTMILSYAAKYSSNFYAPFREALTSDLSSTKKDKNSYQQDPANTDEAMHEVLLDINEGADIIMIKPALSYLDIIYRVKTSYLMPTFAYHVSGEYSMLHLLATATAQDPLQLMLETLISIKRAGADAIITYAALDVAKHLQSK